MYNCFKTISEIIKELPALNKSLVDAGSYFAHLPKNGFGSKETLDEHVALVNRYFEKLVHAHQLDAIINNLISGLKENLDVDTGNYIKTLFVHAIVFHDYGKINERFQYERMNNLGFSDKLPVNSPIGSTHSSLSAFIYLTSHLNEIAISKKSNSLLVICCLYFSYSIFKHHGHCFDDNPASTITFSELRAKSREDWIEVRNFLNEYIRKIQFNLCPEILELIGNEKLIHHPQCVSFVNSFEFYLLCRLNFSLLTASDYLATNDYMNSMSIEDFGVLTKDRIAELHKNISEREWIDEINKKKNYNKNTYETLDEYQFQNPEVKSGDNLNVLRKEMAIEVIRNIRKHSKDNLFFIEAPTGGGKTNLSILATIELLKIYEGLYNKVFYVFPFTTLITQTYSVVCDMLGLSEEEIIELHSKAGLKSDNNEDEYGNNKKNYINYLFVNYPFSLLSHVKFFDILKTNEKETNYLLHRLANSIVVIDELQSYNPAHWDKVIYFIRQYAEKFNIKFILMSATLPKLDKLNVIKQNVEDFVYLLPNAKEQYFSNPNFAGRVCFNFDLFERSDVSLEELAPKVVEASNEYLEYDFGLAKPKGSVYTIIEFIYKQSATEFYEVICDFDFFDEIFVLSGTILEHRRKEVINYLKNPLNRKKKVLLITTQVVEAGVDIDMDLGFKDRSIIDSDEQLAGRINRNVNKEHCILYLFNYNKESVIYGRDLRFKITREQIDLNKYKQILTRKDFDALYNKIFDDRNILNSMEMVQNFSDYELAIHGLKFKTVSDDFKLIEQKNLSCFIPLDVPVQIESAHEGGVEHIFSVFELDFLAQNDIYPNEENSISGEKVFQLYEDSISNKIEFTAQKIRKKVLSSILSKYTFSVFASDKVELELKHFYDWEKSQLGYFYIVRWSEIYSIEKGLDANKLKGIEETQFL